MPSAHLGAEARICGAGTAAGRIAGNLAISRDYVQQCLAQSQAQWKGAMRVGETLRETTEIVNGWWDARQPIEDIEQRADSILGVERLH